MSKINLNLDEKNKSKIIESALKSLTYNYNISKTDILSHIQKNQKKKKLIPVSIFRLGLSPLQALVKYLIENNAYKYSEIARILNRDQRTIWNTYKSAIDIVPNKLDAEKTRYSIDMDIFKNRSLSFLENLCSYLRKKYSLNYHEIAVEIGKDDRTIWTVCNRAKRKRNEII